LGARMRHARMRETGPCSRLQRTPARACAGGSVHGAAPRGPPLRTRRGKAARRSRRRRLLPALADRRPRARKRRTGPVGSDGAGPAGELLVEGPVGALRLGHHHGPCPTQSSKHSLWPCPTMAPAPPTTHKQALTAAANKNDALVAALPNEPATGCRRDVTGAWTVTGGRRNIATGREAPVVLRSRR
jgi:hypothetical protein